MIGGGLRSTLGGGTSGLGTEGNLGAGAGADPGVEGCSGEGRIEA